MIPLGGKFTMSEKKDDKEKLTPEQYQICVLKGTEAPFTGKYTT